MENYPQSFDVCIICALPEEVRALLAVVKPHCEDGLEEYTSPHYGYSYRSAELKNDKDELLTLHISWLSRYGPEEMTLHLSRILEECHPRIAIMTGICAGDAQRVQLGDLVVAERTFTYDNGKFTFDDNGRRVHWHDTMTYQLDANILQFLGLFDEWKALVARLKRPPSASEQRKRRKVACHIKAMASGSAVRADHPFEEVQAPVRGTVAIDMEGAAFGLVMSRHPLSRWLVVKGVCDYADRDKNDTYHDYAARASALYALSFIRAYVTNERLPRPDVPPPSSRAGPPRVWNVPHARNPRFTGRDDLLDQLHQQLTPTGQNVSAKAHTVALTQPLAIKGLGGIGKTQIAVEYAYRSRDQGHYMHTLWVNAASEETIITSLVAIAELLPSFSAKSEGDQRELVEAVKRWLEQCEQRWLLIFDNIDNADDLPIIQEYLPQRGNGSILLTTRAHTVGSIAAASIEVEKMGLMEGSCLLLRRAYSLTHTSDEEVFEHVPVENVNEAGNIVIALDALPLALDQAGAYIEETQCSLSHYLTLYQMHRKQLLARRGIESSNYPLTVETTWSLSFQKVKQASPAAADLLRACAFLAPDAIPEELISNAASRWSSPLRKAAADPFLFDQMIATLHKFSLAKHFEETKTLSIHRLVQAVLIDTMKQDAQRRWAKRVVLAVNDVFPDNPDEMADASQCLRYLDQAQVCNDLIKQYMLPLIEGANLLRRTGLYFYEHALYAIAEPLYQRALQIRDQVLGSEHSDVANSLNGLANLYFQQGRYAEAEALYQRALRIWEQEVGTEHPEVADLLYNLALIYSDQGKYEQAEPLYQRALRTWEQAFGTEHPDVAYALSGLANLYSELGKYVEAEALYQRALRIREKALGAEQPEVADLLYNLAVLYRQQKKYDQAEELYQRALQIYEQGFGSEHPLVASPLNGLANLYRFQEKYEQAEPLYQRALRIWEQALGSEHPDVASALNNLANLYRDQGKYEQAEELYQRALLIWEQGLGADHPLVAHPLNGLANLYHRQGKYEQARLLYERVLDMRQRLLEPQHPDTIETKKWYAALLRAMDRPDEAALLEASVPEPTKVEEGRETH